MASKIEQRSAGAQQKLVNSAEKLVGSTLTQQESADRRTELAANRTLLAAERTYAAWMRTGLAALAAGAGARALLENLVPDWLALASAFVLIVFSEFCFIAGIWRELTGNAEPPRPGVPKLPAWLLIVFNGFLVVLGVAVLIGIASR